MGRIGVVELLLPGLLLGVTLWSFPPFRMSVIGYGMFAPLIGVSSANLP